MGSIHTVLDDAGQVVTRMHFGVFGERQNTAWTGTLSQSGMILQNLLTPRGFTGHEHADGLGIIHMNGRSYDPKLGRFLQADPFIQAPDNSQSLNRYSYALNNPLSYTDPSGFFFKELFNFGRALVRAISSEGFDPGAFADLVASGVALFRSLTAQQSAMPAGVMAGAFVAGPATPTGNQVGEDQPEAAGRFTDVVAATVGGTDSEMTGGGFANGAVTETFTYAQGESSPGLVSELLSDAEIAFRILVFDFRDPLGGSFILEAITILPIAKPLKLLKIRKVAKGFQATKGELKSAAKQIREAGTHPASRNQRVISVGEDANGNIFAGSSGGFDKGQRAAADALGVQRVPTRAGRHAEENLLDAVPDLQRVGTDALDPCPRCLPQLIERGVKIDN